MNIIVCLNVRTHVTSDMCYPAITLLGQICLFLYLRHSRLYVRVYFHTHTTTTKNCITLLYHCSRLIWYHTILRVKHALVYICLYVCTQIVNLLLNKLTHYLLTSNLYLLFFRFLHLHCPSKFCFVLTQDKYVMYIFKPDTLSHFQTLSEFLARFVQLWFIIL